MGVDFRLADERRTVVLPQGSVTFADPVHGVVQTGRNFVVVITTRTASPPPVADAARGYWRGPNTIVSLDASGAERWRKDGYSDVSPGPDDGTLLAYAPVIVQTLDADTGDVLSAEQDH